MHTAKVNCVARFIGMLEQKFTELPTAAAVGIDIFSVVPCWFYFLGTGTVPRTASAS